MGSTLTGVALYERCGYRKSGREEAVKLPNGAGLRVVHMVKDLPEDIQHHGQKLVYEGKHAYSQRPLRESARMGTNQTQESPFRTQRNARKILHKQASH